jgi:hypothetical protein
MLPKNRWAAPRSDRVGENSRFAAGYFVLKKLVHISYGIMGGTLAAELVAV